ncbi:tetratricopeptide repeat protein [Candidatus Aminicenantes bacterium AH-873-B07]|jgi:tetratricopeptide (TPR) repeat protein|nr:tetratricopeptide repeat protein [Candidatus Aminicenantes bacterium AH-873-B07]
MKEGLRNVVIIFLCFLILSFINCERLKISNLKANYHFNKANKFFQDELFRKAIPEYELAIKYNPNLVAAYHYLGECYKALYRPGLKTEENKQRAEKALKYLNKALELNPDNRDVILSLGDMYNKLRNFEKAEKFYLKILEMEPDKSDNYYVIAEFYKSYAGQEKKEESKPVRLVGGKVVEKTEEEKPFEEKTPIEKAEEMYKRVIEMNPNNVEAYARLANFYQEPPLNEFDKAKEYWEKIIELDPNNAIAYSQLGVNRWAKSYRVPNLKVKERLKAAREGIEALKKAIELDPNMPNPYIWLKILYIHLAKLEPQNAAQYNRLADEYGEKFERLRKKIEERKKLEEELKIK